MTRWERTNMASACDVCRKFDGQHDKWCDNNPARPDRLEPWLTQSNHGPDPDRLSVADAVAQALMTDPFALDFIAELKELGFVVVPGMSDLEALRAADALERVMREHESHATPPELVDAVLELLHSIGLHRTDAA